MNQSDKANPDLTCRCGRPAFAYHKSTWLCINCVRRKLFRLVPAGPASSRVRPD